MRIVYIDIDSQRPDHLGCYGYHRNTSPHIDAIAAEGVRFNQYYTGDAPCLPSRTALYSGRLGIQTGVVGHGGTAAEPKREAKWRGFRDRYESDGLPRRLQMAGLHTAMISPFGQRHAAHVFYAGFNEIHNTGKMGMESAHEIWPVVEKWLADHAEQDNWYLHINLWDPHTPYRVPLEYGDPFANDPLPKWLDSDEVIARHNKITGPHSSMEISMYDDKEWPNYPRHPGKVTDRKSMRKFIDGYDTGVRYADDCIGKIVAKLKDAGVYDAAGFIVSADHGENLGELGIYGEHATADIATCRVPFVIKWPGGQKGKVDDGFHLNVDLAPTLLKLLNAKATPAIWDGQSFSETVLTGSSAAREEVVLSQCAHVCQRSMRWGNWLYVRTYHDGFRLFPQEMLFDAKADPHEEHDVAASHPDICREGAWRLLRWHDAQMQKMAVTASDVVDPLWTVIREGGPYHAMHEGEGSPLPGYIQRLEKTGRADGAKALRERYAAFLAAK